MIFGLDIIGLIAWIEINLPVIIPTIAGILPSVAAVMTIILAALRFLKDNKEQFKPVVEQFNQLRAEVRDKTELREVKSQMAQHSRQLQALDKKVDELIALQKHLRHCEVCHNEDK